MDRGVVFSVVSHGRVAWTAVVVAALLVGTAVPAAAEADLVRLAGATRIDTSVEISEHRFPDGAERVFLARQDVFADALAAGTLTGGPTLLVPSCGTVPETVLDEVRRLEPEDVVGLGGQAAVCDEVLDEVADTARAASYRLAGDSRFTTAIEISREAFPHGASSVYLVPADDAPEALAAGALDDGPVLLLPSSGSPDPLIGDELDRLDPDDVVVIGSTSDVPGSAVDAVAGDRPTRRITGSDPSRMSAAVAEAFFDAPVTAVHLVRDDLIADGVAAGSLDGGPVLFVPTCGALPSAVSSAIEDLQATTVVVLGGANAVCDEIAGEASAAGAEGPVTLGRDHVVEDDGFSVVSSVDLSGSTYRPALTLSVGGFDTDASVTFDLSRDHARFRAAIGIPDREADGVTANVAILLDGDEALYLPRIGVGEVHEVDLDVTGVLRLEIVVDELEGSNIRRVGIGHPRVLGDGAVDPTAPDPGGPEGPQVPLTADLLVRGADGCCTEGDVSISGDDYHPAFAMTAGGFDDDARASFDLGRDYDRFVAVVGFPDDQSGSSHAHLTVLVDGREAVHIPGIGIGQAHQLDVDVTGALRLTLVLEEFTGSGVRAFAFGDPELLAEGPGA